MGVSYVQVSQSVFRVVIVVVCNETDRQGADFSIENLLSSYRENDHHIFIIIIGFLLLYFAAARSFLDLPLSLPIYYLNRR